ncbi:peroxide stress protein YaaA [Agrilactobacillus fermenti]|uniref:peroxide stress protein YaaA n=1 Tax=Agrilactobacillus fermenti TaxID=2586909 RepID=UPI001E317948|nr:peroxide stress protein YaaA [Agrilactobacillus fermenti]MCD2255452.1 peroxide stress protein YaaA [Agrilactobacillus fermenti]
MQLIISPAKKMVVNRDDFAVQGQPVFLKKTEQILKHLRTLSYQELQSLWRTSDRLTQYNVTQLAQLDLKQRLTPAILSYAGIQYQSLAADLLSTSGLTYLQQHLWILSAFYGLLRPFDGIAPYRLDMQAKMSVAGHPNLYDFWGDHVYRELVKGKEPIVNLASQEYAKLILPFSQGHPRIVTITFGQYIDGQFKTRATFAKRARGEMVRYLAEHQINQIDTIKAIDLPNYRFCPEQSNTTNFVFAGTKIK